MPRSRSRTDAPLGLFIRAQEQLLIDAAPELPQGRLLCNTAGRGQFARAYAAAHAGNQTTCWFLDVYQRDQAALEGRVLSAKGQVSETESDPQPSTLDPQPSAVSYACTADPPGENYDVVAWACSCRGDGELTREMLQLGHDRLALNGRMVCSIDHPEDQWLHDELKKLFPKVTRRPKEQGVLYLATKTAPLAKHKSYEAEFAFRDVGRLIYGISRPGVFSHRHIDTGARALINTMQLLPGQRVLDLGCGTGVVGLAALCRAENVRVLAVDANPRALECATRGAERNGLIGLETTLDATGDSIPAGEFDVVLANPPYFSHYKIADLFLRMAHGALRQHGLVHVVTKTPDWFAEQMPAYFTDVAAQPVKAYWVVSGRRSKR